MQFRLNKRAGKVRAKADQQCTDVRAPIAAIWLQLLQLKPLNGHMSEDQSCPRQQPKPLEYQSFKAYLSATRL